MRKQKLNWIIFRQYLNDVKNLNVDNFDTFSIQGKYKFLVELIYKVVEKASETMSNKKKFNTISTSNFSKSHKKSNYAAP